MDKTLFLLTIPLNFINFILFGYDKFQAIHDGWRVPERVLLGLSFFGVGIGVLSEIVFFMKKKKKNLFWLATILGIGFLVCLAAFF